MKESETSIERPADLVLGYADPLIAHPGECVAIRVGATADRYGAAFCRLVSEDVDAAEMIEDLGARSAPIQEPIIHSAGSSVLVGPSPVFAELSSFTASIWALPTLTTPRPQTLVSTLTADEGAGWAVLLDRERGVGLRTADQDGPRDVWSELEVAPSAWSHIVVSVDAENTRLWIAVAGRSAEPRAIEKEVRLEAHTGGDALSVGAPHHADRPVGPEGNGCFNGKLSGPTIFAAAIAPVSVGDPAVELAEDPSAPVVCRLDLGDAIDGHRFRDRSPHAHEAVVLNQPTAGVTGPLWKGGASAFPLARAEYSAIHFHDDDLEDAGWEIAFELELPASAASGVYAVRLTSSDCEDVVPFFVTSPGEAEAEAVVLLPTLTYLAYANEHEILSNPPSYKAFTGEDPASAPLGWRDHLAADEGLLSLYDVHRDGSSVCFASTKRPLLNLRPDYEWPLLNGPHGLAMDLRLLGWLEREGLSFDLLTDHDLDRHGAEALEPYRVTITGAHPEYWTGRMLDALDAYFGDGGRLVYLGGNGLHGVTGIDAARRHVAEVRRPAFGSRPSSSGPGEVWLTTTAEEGGTWRNRGRGSHAFVGVGTTAMGAGPGRPYTRSSASHEPAYSWVFDGVDGEEIGRTGRILGGAAAYEFDRADRGLGTPEATEILATADGFEKLYYPMLEDFGASCPEVGDPGSPLVRADMAMTIREDGGGSFAVGSAAWCGSLEEPGVGTVTANVIRRFLETPRGEDPLRRERAIV